MDIGNVIAAVVVLAVLGAVFGFILAVASKVFEVKKDPPGRGNPQPSGRRQLRRLRLPRLRRLCRRHPGGHGSGECVRPCRRGECCRHRKDHGPGGSLR